VGVDFKTVVSIVWSNKKQNKELGLNLVVLKMDKRSLCWIMLPLTKRTEHSVLITNGLYSGLVLITEWSKLEILLFQHLNINLSIMCIIQLAYKK
jgi:hypothetical protein